MRKKLWAAATSLTGVLVIYVTVVALVVGGAFYLRSVSGTWADAANESCADHGGVKSLSFPSAVCRDGTAVHPNW